MVWIYLSLFLLITCVGFSVVLGKVMLGKSWRDVARASLSIWGLFMLILIGLYAGELLFA